VVQEVLERVLLQHGTAALVEVPHLEAGEDLESHRVPQAVVLAPKHLVQGQQDRVRLKHRHPARAHIILRILNTKALRHSTVIQAATSCSVTLKHSARKAMASPTIPKPSMLRSALATVVDL
jgi:hypothetical protein